MAYSLAKRLTYRIMAVVLVMMAIIAGFTYFTVKSYMLQEAQERYEGVLLRDHEEFRRRLETVTVATESHVKDMEQNLNDPDQISAKVEHITRSIKSISRCGLLYIPSYFPDKQRCFGLYAYENHDGSIFVGRIDSTYSVYPERDWLVRGLALDTASWSNVYNEYPLSPNTDVPRQVITYSVPIHNKKGRVVAMLCSDMSLEFLRDEMMDDITEMSQKYEQGHNRHSYNFVINHRGTYIIHPDQKRILNANFYDEAKLTTNKIDDKVVAQMIRGEKGSAMVEIDGVPSWIYYRTVKHMNWIIAIVVPREVIMHNGRMLNTIILLTVLLGLLAIYFICRHMIKEITSPVTAQQAALERELKIAHDIQMAMLPTMPPPSKFGNLGIDLYASETPALDVGGDLYDYYLRDNRLFFCIGDVSGKGMAAALMMAVMRAMFRSETRRADSAAELVTTMNRNLSEESTAGYFVTLFVGILDLQTGHLDYCNAGHEAPLVSGQPLPVKPNLPVGALTEWDYEGQQAQLNDGDMLFLYTDGLSEAKNAEKQQLGRKHVQQLAQGLRADDTARHLIELMESEVRRHVDGAKQSDDITLLAIRWQSQGERTLILQSSMDDIGRLEPFVKEVARQAGISDKETKRLRLAVEESVANVINYGGATAIMLRAHVEDGQLVLTIDDDGQPFDATQESTTDLSIPPDQRLPGGMGIMLLHKMTDGLEYCRKDGHNILVLRKKVNSE